MPKRTAKPSAPLAALRPSPEDHAVVKAYLEHLAMQGTKVTISDRLRPGWLRLVREARAWKDQVVATQERQPDKALAS